jgi:hypothetical protein
VVLSEAEIDSVEAVLERGRPPSTLVPRSRGIVALAARLRGPPDGLAKRAPLFASALGGATRVEASLEPSDAGLALDLSIDLETESAAGRAAKLFEAVRDALALRSSAFAPAVEGATIAATGRSVQLRCTVPPALVLAALRKLE